MNIRKSPFDEIIALPIVCSNCGNILYIRVNKLTYNLWYQGVLSSKEAFPELSDKERNFLVFRKCWYC